MVIYFYHNKNISKIKLNGLNNPINKQRLSDWTFLKTLLCAVFKIHFQYKDRLKVNGGKKIHHENKDVVWLTNL